MKKKDKKKKQYVPRIVPAISTSSKVFLSKKEKNSRNRRYLDKYYINGE